MLESMHVLVTGGAGFIGSQVADALLQQGHDVSIVDDLSSGRRENVPAAATFHHGDIRDAAFLARVFGRHRPAAVSHQAAQTSVSASVRDPQRDASINVLGTLEVLQQCIRTGVERLVLASTGGAVYGDVPEPERASVDRPPRPMSPYACSKLACEVYLGAYQREYGLRATILRYANVYGPRQDPHGEAGVVAIFTHRLLERLPLSIHARTEVGDAGCVRDYVFISDVVRANLLAVQDAIGAPLVNVCSGVGTSTVELAQELGKAIDVEPELRFEAPRPGDVGRSVLDGGAMLEAHPATSLAAGLRQTAVWFAAQHRRTLPDSAAP